MAGNVRTDPVETWAEPKPGGGRRTMARLSGRDAARWQGVADRVVALVERTLGDEVAANRSASRTRWEPGPLGPALVRARRLAASVAMRSEAVVRADVANFYGSVTPSVVHASLRRAGAERDDATTAADLVDGWGSDGCRGLPIGPSPSALVANAALVPLDEALGGLDFLRWVDDVLVGTPENRVDETLDRLDEALDAIGLRRSAAKTSVTSGSRTAWLGASLVPRRPA